MSHLAATLPDRPVLLGHIKIGAKSAEVRTAKSGNEYRAPEKHDYFTLTSLAKDERGDYLPDERLMESLHAYADTDGKLRQIPVMPLSNSLDEILYTRYEWYKGEKLAGYSDGETLTLNYDRRQNVWLREPRTMSWNPKFLEELDTYKKPLFRLHGRLRVSIAAPDARWGGFYQFATHSPTSIGRMYQTLQKIALPTQGLLQGLPLRLMLRPIQVKPNGVPTTVYVTHLELVGSDLLPIHRQAIAQTQQRTVPAALVAPEPTPPATPVPTTTTPVVDGDEVVDGLYTELPDSSRQDTDALRR